ncbi:hypothetical protein G6F35_017066 [Rhizopus arrhizus]|nr:hypothetical protein G6F35_017066 [Rhizopus arrhizus]
MVGKRLPGVGIRHAGLAAAGYREARGHVRAAELLERAQHVVAPFVRHVLPRFCVEACPSIQSHSLLTNDAPPAVAPLVPVRWKERLASVPVCIEQ